MTTQNAPRSQRVLVVEDEMLIAMIIEDALTYLDCEIVGPAGTLDAAMKLARDEPLDAALLDVTIRGGDVFPVAELLVKRGIPFAFSSGYGDWALPEAFKGQRRLTKPFTNFDLEDMIRSLCDRPSRHSLIEQGVGPVRL
ncbi:response regulator [Brevundimonas sp.]|uniref:response regulator n=1 Tax=Brevundimonas sp. TaxID=1871086 RepID=UPI0027316DDC|nr:response regulator [Brevundimonas sp.]MDP1913748.1 response regulator [Brevundimonas sp.]